MKRLIKNFIWRLQFKKVAYTEGLGLHEGRCVNCDAGNPSVECSKYYCPCNYNQQLKRVRAFKYLTPKPKTNIMKLNKRQKSHQTIIIGWSKGLVGYCRTFDDANDIENMLKAYTYVREKYSDYIMTSKLNDIL